MPSSACPEDIESLELAIRAITKASYHQGRSAQSPLLRMTAELDFYSTNSSLDEEPKPLRSRA